MLIDKLESERNELGEKIRKLNSPMKSKILIVGSGITGSTFANLLACQGNKVTVIERRNHIAGNIYTKEIDGIQVHQYGAHIFHTSNKKVWNYVQRFAEFNRYINSPKASYHGKMYSLPFNMNTFNELWGVTTPKEALNEINRQRQEMNGKSPNNLEEQAISLVGRDIYEKLIKGYTEKQWGRSCKELPPFIIKRIPVRLTYNNDYFNDQYEGIPISGYTKMIKKMLAHPNITVKLNTDFFDKKSTYLSNYAKIIYTGEIDKFFDYKFGQLEYRSLRFKTREKNIENYQGNAVINYTDAETPYTRVIEHKHFNFRSRNSNKTIITWEYPINWHTGEIPYYPINNETNNDLYQKYAALANKQDQVIFAGRLGTYRYLNMDQAINQAIIACKNNGGKIKNENCKYGIGSN